MVEEKVVPYRLPFNWGKRKYYRRKFREILRKKPAGRRKSSSNVRSAKESFPQNLRQYESCFRASAKEGSYKAVVRWA